MALTGEQTDEVFEMLDLYAKYYREKNYEKLLSITSKGISGFGSGPDEIVADYTGFKESVARDLSQAERVEITFYVFRLDGTMPCAWVTAFCIFDVVIDGEHLPMQGRMTALLQNTGSRWLFEQIHFSMPNVEQGWGESFPGAEE
ncbi:MAG: nuclear transport factor 2 family protein [Methanoregulaceae archaeon]|jgi:hypothetical protein|nr:nuclear transport factor 2 family protein [Methanoregulaceae archaeon]